MNKIPTVTIPLAYFEMLAEAYYGGKVPHTSPDVARGVGDPSVSEDAKLPKDLEELLSASAAPTMFGDGSYEMVYDPTRPKPPVSKPPETPHVSSNQHQPDPTG